MPFSRLFLTVSNLILLLVRFDCLLHFYICVLCVVRYRYAILHASTYVSWDWEMGIPVYPGFVIRFVASCNWQTVDDMRSTNHSNCIETNFCKHFFFVFFFRLIWFWAFLKMRLMCLVCAVCAVSVLYANSIE